MACLLRGCEVNERYPQPVMMRPVSYPLPHASAMMEVEADKALKATSQATTDPRGQIELFISRNALAVIVGSEDH